MRATACVAAASTTGRTDRHVVHAREPARRPRAIAVRESRIGGRLRLSKNEGVSTQEVGYYEYSRGPIQGRVREWWSSSGETPTNVCELSAHDAAGLQHLISQDSTDNVLVVEFFAGWCTGCRAIYPKLMKIARDEFPKARFLKVNIDEHEELSRTLGVDRLPMFMVYRHGASQDTFTASMSARGLQTLRRNIKRHYQS